jgi:microcystin-dependent protein
MMARTAEWRDDVSGAIVTGGTSTAYTVTSFQVFDTLVHMNSQMIAFTPHATNADTVTLNVDGLGAKPLRSAPSVELPSGSLILGTPYVATYNNSDGAWYLQGGVSNPYAIPVGGMIPYSGATAPNSAFILPYGQAISRTTYSVYFNLVGTGYGTGNGSTTFNVPDLRGNLLAGVDNMGGSAANRITGLVQGTQTGAATHTLTASEIPSHTHSGTTSLQSANHTHAFQQGNAGNTGSPVAAMVPIGTGSGAPASTTESANHTHSFTTDGGTGGGAAHSIVQPTLGMVFILRII